MAPSRISTFDITNRALGGILPSYLRELRAGGNSWREVSYRLRDEHHVDVSIETLRRWYNELEREAS